MILADLLHRLGDISPSRVLLVPTPGTATIDDVEQNKRCELVEGTLVERATGFPESYLGSILTWRLYDYVRACNLGIVIGAGCPLEISPGLVRRPAGTYFSWDDLPGRRIPEESVPNIAPTLVIEVLSKGNTPAEMARKRAEYFAAGSRVMWVIDRFTLTTTVYTAVDQFRTLTLEDTLDGGDVLPGFALKLNDLFCELHEHG